MNKALTFLSVILLAGCATTQHDGKPSWSDLNMPGLIIDLKDPKRVDWYLFHSKGTVSATFGTRGVELCSPIFYWKAKKDILTITDDDKSIVEKFRLVEVRKDEVLVQKSSGDEVLYKMKRN